MRKRDIVTAKQSFIAIYDDRNIFSYLPPGQSLSEIIVPVSLSEAFKDFFYYDFSKAIEIDAVAGRLREPYPNELWKNNADTLVMVKPIKHENITSDIWSLYKGLEGLIRNNKFPIFIPEQSMIYDGVKVLEFLDTSPSYSSGILETRHHWRNLIKKMEGEITKGKPAKNTTPQLT